MFEIPFEYLKPDSSRNLNIEMCKNSNNNNDWKKMANKLCVASYFVYIKLNCKTRMANSGGGCAEWDGKGQNGVEWSGMECVCLCQYVSCCNVVTYGNVVWPFQFIRFSSLQYLYDIEKQFSIAFIGDFSFFFPVESPTRCQFISPADLSTTIFFLNE